MGNFIIVNNDCFFKLRAQKLLVERNKFINRLFTTKNWFENESDISVLMKSCYQCDCLSPYGHDDRDLSHRPWVFDLLLRAFAADSTLLKQQLQTQKDGTADYQDKKSVTILNALVLHAKEEKNKGKYAKLVSYFESIAKSSKGKQPADQIKMLATTSNATSSNLPSTSQIENSLESRWIESYAEVYGALTDYNTKLNAKKKPGVLKKAGRVIAKKQALKNIIDACTTQSQQQAFAVIESNKTVASANTSILPTLFFQIGHKGRKSTTQKLVEELEKAMTPSVG